MARKSDDFIPGDKTVILVIAPGLNSDALPSELFTSRGYETVRATDLGNGLETAKEIYPDLILMNLQSTGTAGFEWILRIREDPFTEHLPIFVLSSDSSSMNRINALDLGADDCLSQPYDFDEIVSRVEAILRRTRSQSDHRRFQINLVTYLAKHYESRGYKVFSPLLRETPAVPKNNWSGPAPDLTIVRRKQATAVATETVQSLLREETPERWLAFLENDIAGLRIVVRDRESQRIANRIKKAMDLPIHVSRVRHRTQSSPSPRLRLFRLRRKQRRAIALGGVILVLAFLLGFTQPANRLGAYGMQMLTWFVLQGKHYRPKDLEREMMDKLKEKGEDIRRNRMRAVETQ
jgi:CheY-like chemotaxis protein